MTVGEGIHTLIVGRIPYRSQGRKRANRRFLWQKEVKMFDNNGFLLILILLLIFATTGANGISGDESLILILLTFGMLLISNSNGLFNGRRGCDHLQ